jgi:4-hydroxy-tetrahydrodipicolinate reductase
MKPIRVLQWGLGAMGGGMARLMLDKAGLQIVAAVDGRPDFAGKDLGEVLGLGKTLGVAVTNRPEDVLDKNNVDLVVIATTSWTKEQWPDLCRILSAGINCISIAEEMADPYAQNPALAAEIDALAKQQAFRCWGRASTPATCSTCWLWPSPAAITPFPASRPRASTT